MDMGSSAFGISMYAINSEAKMDKNSEQAARDGVERAWTRAKALVNGLLNRPEKTDSDSVAITREGMAPEMMAELLANGFTHQEIDWIVPPGTLSHRLRNRRRSTPDETGRFLRTLKVRAMAEAVLGSPERALAWLRRPRQAFGGNNAMRLLRTDVGGQIVEEMLGQLDEGYLA